MNLFRPLLSLITSFLRFIFNPRVMFILVVLVLVFTVIMPTSAQDPNPLPTEPPVAAHNWYELLVLVSQAIGDALAPYAAYAVTLVVALTNVFKRAFPNAPEGAPTIVSAVLSAIAAGVGIIIATQGKVTFADTTGFLDAIAGLIGPALALFFGTSTAAALAYTVARDHNVTFFGHSRTNPKMITLKATTLSASGALKAVSFPDTEMDDEAFREYLNTARPLSTG